MPVNTYMYLHQYINTIESIYYIVLVYIRALFSSDIIYTGLANLIKKKCSKITEHIGQWILDFMIFPAALCCADVHCCPYLRTFKLALNSQNVDRFLPIDTC